ncbi:L-2-hydroxyglutarate dehydrogenase [Azospirillaceae bacterium]
MIHAGIYYPTGSVRASLCRGARLLYAFRSHTVCISDSKILVATDPTQIPKLDALHKQAQANGVHDLQRLSPEEVHAREPQIKCVAALFSPSTGIIDSHGLILALQGDAEKNGAVVALNSPVIRGRVRPEGGFEVEIGGASPSRITCSTLINSAGLGAQGVARAIHGNSAPMIPPLVLAKGNYFTLSGCRTPFRHLIYPMPDDGGLGVHVTLDLAGQARFGPDVEWLSHNDVLQIDYSVDPKRADAFYGAVRRYWPELPKESLVPAYSGVRPKLTGPGQSAADFMILGPKHHKSPDLFIYSEWSRLG